MRRNGQLRPPSEAELALLDPDGSFRQRLLEDRDTLRRLLAAGDAWPAEALVHRLAGAAGTFGHGALGDLALALDEAFLTARQAGSAPPDVGPLLHALDRTLRSA